ncbi:MAG TPA: SDR family oxidoreductase [Candidatus Dormibacteraeota bacterium]|jgi:NAD(P)-dependent dehydrogenase (short-subunit alcohol dehydrogenase family)
MSSFRGAMELDHKVVLVTGGASGVGRAFARIAARQGADVVVADLDDERLEAGVQELVALGTGRRFHALRCDLRKDADVKAMAADALATMGRVDVLVNAAGVFLGGSLEKISVRDWEWMLQVNLLGTVRTVRALLPQLQALDEAYIVNTVSFGGLVPQGPLTIPYDASQAAIAHFTEGLALHGAPHGVRVSLFCLSKTEAAVGTHTRIRGTESWFGAGEPVADDGSQGLEPVARLLADGIRNEEFLILESEAERALIARRFTDQDPGLTRQQLNAPRK